MLPHLSQPPVSVAVSFFSSLTVHWFFLFSWSGVPLVYQFHMFFTKTNLCFVDLPYCSVVSLFCFINFSFYFLLLPLFLFFIFLYLGLNREKETLFLLFFLLLKLCLWLYNI